MVVDAEKIFDILASMAPELRLATTAQALTFPKNRWILRLFVRADVAKQDLRRPSLTENTESQANQNRKLDSWLALRIRENLQRRLVFQ